MLVLQKKKKKKKKVRNPKMSFSKIYKLLQSKSNRCYISLLFEHWLMLMMNRSGKGILGPFCPILFSNHESHLDCGIIGQGSVSDTQLTAGYLVRHV